MCVLAIAWQAHPDWQLVVAANRDEFHDRPADPLARWKDTPIIAGRDRRAGGTWLAVSEEGRFAAVTNLRGHGGAVSGRTSRGDLVVQLAAGGAALTPERLRDYNPFNAVSIDGATATLRSNRPLASEQPLERGLHTMSNGPLATPWRNAQRLAGSVRTWLIADDRLAVSLLSALHDPEPPSDLPGDPAAIFLRNRQYGTRCSTVVLVDRIGEGVIVERRYNASGEVAGETSLRFNWP